MSQKGDITILVPGEIGWEVWSGPPSGPFELAEATEFTRAGDIPRLPSGDILLLFPVRMITSLPFRAPTGDDELFDDLATMHIERVGLRPDEHAGNLTDTFIIDQGEEEARLLTVVLRTPADGELPLRSPKEFDLSARALPMPENAVVMWREFGRWVFTISGPGGVPVYSQATTCEAEQPDGSVVGDIQLALTQLALQGFSIDPNQVIVWSGDERAARPEAIETLFPGRVKLEAKPAVTLPQPRSKLLPEDVRAARRQRARERRKYALIGAATLIYLGLVAWLGIGLFRDHGKMKKLAVKADGVRPIAEQFEKHQLQWGELAPVVDTDEWPIQLLLRCVRQIPAGGQLRLSVAELTSSDVGRIQQMRLVGEAPDPGPIQKFSLALSRSDLLSMFQWETPPPQQTKKGTWSFTFIGARS